jgi:hypothetical protein
MTAHKMAPPDLAFAARLRSLAAAAEREREACEEAERAGLLWRPIPGAQGARPVRDPSGHPPTRSGASVGAIRRSGAGANHAITGTNVRLVGRRFGELAFAAAALAEAVEVEDQRTLLELRREAV